MALCLERLVKIHINLHKSGDHLGCLQVDLLQPGGGSFSGELITILYISDTHCGEPMCCRETNEVVDRVEDMAGYWGDFRKCGTLLRIIESMYKYIATIHPSVDFIYWTGGFPAHDIWNQTKEGGARK